MQWIKRRAASLLWAGMLVSVGAPASPTPRVRLETVHWSDGKASAERADRARVELGLDHELQLTLDHTLASAHAIAAGAVLVDVATGQVLAVGEVGASTASLLVEPVAPAASVFKLVTTAALYEKTHVTPRTLVCTAGGVREINDEHLRPASGPEATCAAFGQALGASRNAAYAQLATTELMRSDLVELSQRLGYASDLALDIKGQVGFLEIPYNDLDFARTATGFESSSSATTRCSCWWHWRLRADQSMASSPARSCCSSPSCSWRWSPYAPTCSNGHAPRAFCIA